eukprot:TRINITY_DN4663_c0_g1_i2.p1 TRINITY_DN4663_c0_g1~~TRINITY_DN4663_c0_g1_i2.p1  ORF type:complete len:230 (-),score=49.63 TRINITY_DN4663_c0_g1_i2:659-1294(-)
MAMDALGRKTKTNKAASVTRRAVASAKQQKTVAAVASLSSLSSLSCDSEPNLWIATWNTDGISADTAIDRAHEICSILIEALPGSVACVVCLQEVTPLTAPVFVERLKSSGLSTFPYFEEQEFQGVPYFTLMFMRMNADMNLKRSSRISFENSKMGRDVCEVRCVWNDLNLMFLTSHFESLAQGADERVRQFREVLESMHAFDGLAVFGMI